MDGKVYQSEAEFLKDYDPNQFDRLSLTADILIFSVSSEKTNNYRKLSDKYLSVLLVKRNNYPFKDKWCLPGGFVGIEESIDKAAERILERETNLKDIYIEQLYTFGDPKRDPRMRVVSTAYVALVDKDQLTTPLKEEARWFRITTKEAKGKIEVVLKSEEEILTFQMKKVLKDRSSDRYWYEEIENKEIAFDHTRVIVSGLSRIKNKLEYTDIAFHLVPEEFTLGELQQVYEVILGKQLLDPAFRRIIADKVEKTGHYQTGGGHRPSALFRYKNKKN